MQSWLKQNATLGNILTLISLVAMISIGYAVVKTTAESADYKATRAQAQAVEVGQRLDMHKEEFRKHCERAQEIQSNTNVKFARIEMALEQMNKIQDKMDKKLEQILDKVNKRDR